MGENSVKLRVKLRVTPWLKNDRSPKTEVRSFYFSVDNLSISANRVLKQSAALFGSLSFFTP
jgi:hypothetical protein